MLRELLASFNVDTGQAVTALKKIDNSIEGAKDKLGALATAFVGSALIHGMKEFVEHQIELGSRVNDLSEKLGVGTDDLQQFQFAAKLVGVESEGAASALGFLSKNMGLALEGNKEAVEAFTKMKVELKDSSGQVRELGDVLPEVADAFEKVESSQERTALAMKIFGKQGAALIPLLKDGSGGLKAMYAEFDRLGGGMSKEFVHAADKAGDEIDKLKFALAGWKSQIAFAILPALTGMITKAQTWVGGLRKVTRESHLAEEAWIVMGIAGAAAGAKAAAGFAQFLGILPKDAGFWKTVLGLGEIALIAVGVALLALAFEDFFSMLQGDQSIIGDLIDKFLGMGQANELVKELGQAWTLLSGLFAEDLTTLAPLVDLFKDLAKSVIPYAVAGFVDMVKIVASLVTLTAAFVKTLMQVATFDFEAAGKTIMATGKSVFGEGGLLNTSAVGNMQLRNEARANAPKDVTGEIHNGGRFGGGGSQAVHQTNHIDVTVEGGSNARETGAAVKDGLKGGLNDTLRDAFGAVGTGG